MSWPATELDRIGAAVELDLAARRADGSLSPYTTMWVARAGDDLYVRSAYGPDSVWYRRALRHGHARIRAGGVERDVSLTHVAQDDPVHAGIDEAMHVKYDRYGERVVATVVGADATLVTLRLDTT
jgi:hypothetical protein